MKKEEMARKMGKESCEHCGSHKHKTREHRRGSAESGGDRGDIIESNYGGRFKGGDDFSKKDVMKERAGRRKKNGPLNKGGDWET